MPEDLPPPVLADVRPGPDPWAPARTFAQALADQDFVRLEACLDPEVHFRALLPSGLREREGAKRTADLFRGWFKGIARVTMLDSGVDPITHRAHLWYRLEEVYLDGETEVIEQNAFCEVKAGRISSMDLVCSGHLPVGPRPPSSRVRRFDAGDLGCGSGLPQEFRVRIASLPLGGALEVRTKDPSAKEDLPALARLLGHRVVSVRSTAEGENVIIVERGR